MAPDKLPRSSMSQAGLVLEPVERSAASYECELTRLRSTEILLREMLACEVDLRTRKDDLLRQQELLRKESDHRLLNSLQMIVSLLSLQRRMAPNSEAGKELAIAVDRIATIERVHRRLHLLDGAQTVAFKGYLEDLCRDFSIMVASNDCLEQAIVVEACEIDLPSAKALPLAFIVNELMTNAVKYGKGRIAVTLEKGQEGFELSVVDDGAGFPEGFQLAASKGLGIKIIRSFVDSIGGELQVGRGDKNRGARFAVLFT